MPYWAVSAQGKAQMRIFGQSPQSISTLCARCASHLKPRKILCNGWMWHVPRSNDLVANPLRWVLHAGSLLSHSIFGVLWQSHVHL